MIAVTLTGMSCQNCARHVRQALAALPGVTSVQVDLDQATAHISGNDELDDARIAAVLDEEGYTVTLITRN